MEEACSNQILDIKPCADNCKLNFLSYLLCSDGVRFPTAQEMNMSHCVSDPLACVHSLLSVPPVPSAHNPGFDHLMAAVNE